MSQGYANPGNLQTVGGISVDTDEGSVVKIFVSDPQTQDLLRSVLTELRAIRLILGVSNNISIKQEDSDFTVNT